jgi:hypothetical protein
MNDKSDKYFLLRLKTPNRRKAMLMLMKNVAQALGRLPEL